MTEYDIMNKKTMFGDTELRNAFGTDLGNQTTILHKIIYTMKTMKIKSLNSRHLYSFQKGIKLSCQYLIVLYTMIKESYIIQYRGYHHKP